MGCYYEQKEDTMNIQNPEDIKSEKDVTLDTMIFTLWNIRMSLTGFEKKVISAVIMLLEKLEERAED